MGNTNSASPKNLGAIDTYHGKTQHVDLSAILSGLSARSLGQSIPSTASCRSSSKLRTSRRKLRNSSFSDPFLGSKTLWPVTFCESPFLPDFPIQNGAEVLQLDVLETLASGSYGEVFKVRKRDSGTFYAMKVMSKAKVKDELRIHQMCGHHPFLVSSPFHWQSRKQIFLVTEFIEGGDLHHLWKETGSLDEELVKHYVAELSLALDFLHNAGVIYRDLKLENVLLDSNGHARLIDFGLSKWLPLGQKTKTLCGTLQYMAPEVLQQEPYTHAVDWWSLGVLLYALLQGQFPFTVSTTLETSALGQFEFGATSKVSAAARNLVSCLLTTKPQQRLRSLRALQQHGFYHRFNFESLRSKQFDLLPLLERQRARQREVLESAQRELDCFEEEISVLE